MTIGARLAGHLRSQDWNALLLELVVVVVGIFLGLQANDWYEDFEERGLEREYIEGLLADLELEIEHWDQYRERAMTSIRDIELIEAVMEDESLAVRQPERFVAALRSFANSAQAQIARSTFDSMVGSGRLRLIEDRPLRDALTRHYRLHSSYTEVQREAGEVLVEARLRASGVLPVRLRQTISMTYLMEGTARVMGPLRDIELADGDAVAARDRLLARPALADILPEVAYIHNFLGGSTVYRTNEARDLMANLEERLAEIR